MKIENKTILAIAPHLDDIELGCFGSLHKLSSKNNIYYLNLSFPNNIGKEDILKNSVYKSLEMLSIPKENLISYEYDTRDLYNVRSEILQNFYDVNKKINPDIIFIPSSYDIHQTHQVVHEEALRIFKNKTILGYEFPWNNFSFKPDAFIKLSKENFEAKEEIISQFPSHGKNSFFENGIIRDLANLRGKQIGGEFAEAFELIRLICE
ncbi:MAG: PIG-L family deacetylase [Candidatus Moranbacteria bacterium]|nr:PIG-L family deacetylase [Candidatus Moranbacteria bacterium]